MRVIGGCRGGIRLAGFTGDRIRPTSDKVKGAVFSILDNLVPDYDTFADLFAGTGALGIEAISRGAGSCTLIERDRDLARHLQATLDRLKIDNAHVVNADAMNWLSGPAQAFDLVFLDPPFGAGLWGDAAARLESGGWLADAAMIHVESAVGSSLALPANWHLHRETRAGAVQFALYRRTPTIPLS